MVKLHSNLMLLYLKVNTCININNAQANYNGISAMEYFQYHQSSSSDPHNDEIFESDLSIAFYGTDQYYGNSDTISCVFGSENIGGFNMGFNIGGFNPPPRSGFNATAVYVYLIHVMFLKNINYVVKIKFNILLVNLESHI